MNKLFTDTRNIYTPSELNREVKLHIEAGFGNVWVEAEISNLARPASGHLYFSLKDSKAQIRCALFRPSAQRLGFRPENGQQVLAKGRLGLYEARGEFQMIVETMEESGEGRLRAEFEALKRKLDAEGLFDSQHKKSLPGYPRRIGVVTSPSGAVIRDIVKVLGRRWPLAQVRLYPSAVQGEEAPGAIVRAVVAANRHGWAETLICGRGGGSLEDLWAFNDERVARAVFDSGIPVISAVGHETDTSICDFVADLRAPTPSAAAEMAVPDHFLLRREFERHLQQLTRRMRDRLQRAAQGVDHLDHRLQQRHAGRDIVIQRQRLGSLRSSLESGMAHRLRQYSTLLSSLRARLDAQHPGLRLREHRKSLTSQRARLEQLASQMIGTGRRRLQDLARTLNAVSPLPTLARGYAVLSDQDNGNVLSSVDHASVGQQIAAQLSDGRLQCTVDSVSDETLESPEDGPPMRD